MTMQAPETQSTGVGWDWSVTAGNWLRTIELLGKRRVRREVRPRNPERALISRRAESCRRPSESTILGPKIPAFGFSERNASRCSKKSRSTRVSGFMRTTRSPLDTAMPLLWARAKPMFSLLLIRRTREGSSGTSIVSLSTTKTSKSP
jgi:hypothetical protein